MLNRVWTVVDGILERYGLLKVDVAGDCYICAGGITDDRPDHAARVARFALDLVRETRIPVTHSRPDLGYINVRVGINTGSVMSSMIGDITPRWSLFGDTVNVASRMETTSLPGRIHMTATTAAQIKVHAPELKGHIERRLGILAVKGKGTLQTFWLNSDSTVARSNSWGEGNLSRVGTKPPAPALRTRSRSQEFSKSDFFSPV